VSTKPQTLVGARYRLERQIGAGATARVWVAFDQVLERRVAIKMLAGAIDADSAHIERFRREARAVANLAHPHIVTVLDSGEHDGMPFIVLEYVDGETLKERIQRVGRLTITEALAFAIEVARALEAAHAHGLVHRDVKPQNILIDNEGGAKITDFGIARSGDEDGLTLGGRVLGTTDYISPEQALGHEVTGQSDIYSLGVVLYESLTGSVPFSAPSHIAVATMHVRDEIPDLQQRRPEVSAALAAVVERATAKHLARRYANAGELIAGLEEVLAIETARTGEIGPQATLVLRSVPGHARRFPATRGRRPWALAGAVALSLVAAVALAAFLLTRTHGGGGRAKPLTGTLSEQRVALAPGSAVQYNPFGTAPEDPASVGDAIDDDLATSWQTSTYVGGVLGKSGVGLYVQSSPRVAANEVVVTTPTPGFRVQVWGADLVPAITYSAYPRAGLTPRRLGWTLLGHALASANTKIPLGHVRPRRYYLLWITSLGADPQHAGKSVQISEFKLYRGASGAQQR
jgi:eukaryotic-like serine/threonine-protein kinase